MKTSLILLTLALVVAVIAMPIGRSFLMGCAEKLNDSLFNFQVRNGMVLGMADFTSRQAAGLAASPKTKIQPYDNGGICCLVASTPAVAAWAQNDTFTIGLIPKGSRILRSSKMWNGAFGAGVTMSIGLRDPVTKVAIDAAGLLAATSVATAGLAKNIDNGNLLNQVGGYITTADVEVYATLAAAAPTANAQAEFEIQYLSNSPT